MEYYVPKSSILIAGTGVWEISSVAYGFSSINIDFSDYLKSLISRINKVEGFFFNKIFFLKKHKLHFSRLFCCDHTKSCNCVNMVSVTSASRYIKSASRYIT